MPELPEVETTRRGIERAATGQRVRELRIYDPRLRWPIEADLPQQLAGQRIIGVVATRQVPAARALARAR